MRPYPCPNGDQTVFFDDLVCTGCQTALAHSVSRDLVVPITEGTPCENRGDLGCSFLVEDDGGPLCRSCRLTAVHPPVEDAEALAQWAAVEAAKRQVLAQCLRLGVDIEWVTFELRSSAYEPVTIGHADGVITIDVREADDVVRTRMQAKMDEPYRTMVGHLRHELGHAVWQKRVGGDRRRLASFRSAFGDERVDYAEALEAHYSGEPPADWNDRFVSVYATSHPWEDFAETFAHVLHITDALDTADRFGISVDGPTAALTPPEGDDGTASAMVARWLPLAYGLNALNRSMGRAQAYPFVLAPAVVDKMQWVLDLIAPARDSAIARPA